MKSEYSIFNIPIGMNQSDTRELNLFIQQNRVIQISKELVRTGDTALWSFLLEYLPGQQSGTTGNRDAAKPFIDYRDILSSEDFALFIKLKEIRAALSETSGQPVYAVCTNEQLAEIAKRKPATMTALQEIRGIGEAKAKAYGQTILDGIKTSSTQKLVATHEATGKAD
jgi:superfamily II DNA helicase RecQ